MWLGLFILILSYLITGTIKNLIACWKMIESKCDTECDTECEKCKDKNKLTE